VRSALAVVLYSGSPIGVGNDNWQSCLEELERFQFCIERFVGDELAVDHCRHRDILNRKARRIEHRDFFGVLSCGLLGGDDLADIGVNILASDKPGGDCNIYFAAVR